MIRRDAFFIGLGVLDRSDGMNAEALRTSLRQPPAGAPSNVAVWQ
jgi:hypothetical protein